MTLKLKSEFYPGVQTPAKHGCKYFFSVADDVDDVLYECELYEAGLGLISLQR